MCRCVDIPAVCLYIVLTGQWVNLLRSVMYFEWMFDERFAAIHI